MRLTEFASPSSIAAVRSSGLLRMERPRNGFLGVLYSHEESSHVRGYSFCAKTSLGD